MQNYYALLSVIDHIERNLTEPLELSELAASVFMSLSNLHRVFRFAFRCSLKDYITKRRMCRAAFDLINSDARITDIALSCQYENAESFTRAFRKQFRVTPSEFRSVGRTFYDLYPRLLLSDYKKGDIMETIRRFDVNELSAQILGSKGTYVLYLDIDHLLPLNETRGHAAGDAALAETAARIERAILPGMTFFRTGNDDFTVLTGSAELEVAEHIAAAIIARAGDEVAYSGGSFTFTVSIGIAMIPAAPTDYKDAIAVADKALLEAKRSGRNKYMVSD